MRFAFAPSGVALPELSPAPSAAPSVVALSLPKAGSTLLFGLLEVLAPVAGLAYVSTQDWFFLQGVPLRDQPPEAAALFRPTGYCYGGFRGLPPFDIPILPAARCIVLVRDPRDMAVSSYHSLARSHVLPPPDAAGREHFLAQHRRARAAGRPQPRPAVRRLRHSRPALAAKRCGVPL